MHGLYNVIIPYKNKIIEKPNTILLLDLWFLSSSKKFENSIYLRELELPKNWPRDELFELRKSKFWVRHFF